MKVGENSIKSLSEFVSERDKYVLKNRELISTNFEEKNKIIDMFHDVYNTKTGHIVLKYMED